MSLSTYYLNQRISILQAEINGIVSGGVPTTSDLAVVLTNGNSAGTSDIDMNTNDILQVNNIDLVTINGSAYPPVVGADALSDVLLIGNNAGTTDIDMNSNDILLVNNIDLVTINGSAYPPVVGADTLSAVLTAGNNAGTNDIDMGGNYILDARVNEPVQSYNIADKQFVYDTRLEDFDCDTGNTQLVGQTIVFNESGSGAVNYYAGLYAIDVIGGVIGRRGILQMVSGGSAGQETSLITDLIYSIANITNVRFGFIPLGNENLATLGRIPAGNIFQLLGLSQIVQPTGTATSQSIIWRLTSTSATIPVWNFVMNNVVYYSLVMADPTGDWCSVSIDITEPTAGNYFVQSTFSNFTTGVVETTAIYPLPVGFLTTPNSLGVFINTGTNNNTNKYMAVDYAQLTQNLYNVGGGITSTLYR